MLATITPEQLFSVSNMLALAGWGVLILAPRWRWGASLVSGAVIPSLLAITYVVIVATQLPGASGGFGSLRDVATLFANPWVLLAGWVHYLAFDLFIGSWQVRDAQARGVPHLLVIPCLVLTFLLGPAGLLVYFGIRAVKTNTVALSSDYTAPVASIAPHDSVRS